MVGVDVIPDVQELRGFKGSDLPRRWHDRWKEDLRAKALQAKLSAVVTSEVIFQVTIPGQRHASRSKRCRAAGGRRRRLRPLRSRATKVWEYCPDRRPDAARFLHVCAPHAPSRAGVTVEGFEDKGLYPASTIPLNVRGLSVRQGAKKPMTPAERGRPDMPATQLGGLRQAPAFDHRRA